MSLRDDDQDRSGCGDQYRVDHADAKAVNGIVNIVLSQAPVPEPGTIIVEPQCARS
jgi:hypothetical protein